MSGLQIRKRSVQKYDRPSIVIHWLLLIIVSLLIITGIIPFLNWFFLELNVYEVSFSELPYSSELHQILGFIFVVIIIVYFGLYLKTSKNIVSDNPRKDIKSFNHSLIYLIGLSGRRDKYENDVTMGSQKILFILFLYVIGLVIISGLLLSPNASLISGNELEPSFENGLFVTHILAISLFIILIIIFIGSIIRRLDLVAIKILLIDGKVPLWYIKKNHRLWYDEILSEGPQFKERTDN
ncbi:MAG: cytochrome b/b6 domain-containing protein [Thermoplasmata archaeon]|nr:MAG: cytochrome b/b6 domain-containing protein [Thermoplasmata archaeon]